MKKFLPLMLVSTTIICWTAAYFLSGQPEETVRISSYSQFIKGNINRNFIVEFDEQGYTSCYKKEGHGSSGFYKYLTKNDTSILVYDKNGEGDIDMPAFLTYSGVENYYKLMEEIDTIGFFLGDSNARLVFEKISGKDDLAKKNEGLVVALVMLPMLLYFIVFKIYGFVLWLKENN
jgi:hypothetical protein